MPLIQVFMHREWSAEDGLSALETMGQHLQGTVATGQGRLHVPGITRRDNPFPVWLQTELGRNGFVYNAINLAYQKEVPDEAAGERFCQWFDSVFRVHYAPYPKYNATIQQVHVRVMMDAEETQHRETY